MLSQFLVLVFCSLALPGVMPAADETWDKKISVNVKPSKICDSNSKPVIVIKPEPKYVIDLGKQVKIVCAADGAPAPFVYWIKGKKSKSGEERRLGPTSIGKSILYFDKLTDYDVDTYTCVVEDCCRGTVQTIETEIVVPIKITCIKRWTAGYHIFHPVFEYKNWTESKVACEKNLMILATPKNAQQNADLVEAIQKAMGSDPNKKKFHHSNMVWIGIGDGVSETNFTDINTGKPVTYFNWMKKQPDNWKKHNKIEGQDCVAIDRVSGQWDDSFSKWERPFACWCPPK